MAWVIAGMTVSLDGFVQDAAGRRTFEMTGDTDEVESPPSCRRPRRRGSAT